MDTPLDIVADMDFWPMARTMVDAAGGPAALRARSGAWPSRLNSLVDVLWRVLMTTIVLSGVAGIVAVWASDRGLWNDEVVIALSLREESFIGLTGPLIAKQVAPPGWLMSEKALFEMLGGDEQVLRLPQMLAAVALLGLTATIAHHVLGRWAALAATGLV